jgi:DNA-binding transcriptional ArsR family regulator
MIGMSQEIEHINGRKHVARELAGRLSFLLLSNFEEDRSHGRADDATARSLELSSAILGALGDECSRRILRSAVASGKTAEEISAEQDLPLSTCYRTLRRLLNGGLVILEKRVITRAGKRYAVYRTSFSKATIRFNGGEVTVEVVPNLDVLDKLRGMWLSASYPSQNHDDRPDKSNGAPVS